MDGASEFPTFSYRGPRLCSSVQEAIDMKPITALYVEMLRDMDINSIKQAKRLIKENELRHYLIPVEQHNWKYAIQALAHIVTTKIDKTAPKSKSAIRKLSLHLYRQNYLEYIDRRIKELPDGDPFKEAIRITRIAIAEQQVPLSDIDY